MIELLFIGGEVPAGPAGHAEIALQGGHGQTDRTRRLLAAPPVTAPGGPVNPHDRRQGLFVEAGGQMGMAQFIAWVVTLAAANGALGRWRKPLHGAVSGAVTGVSSSPSAVSVTSHNTYYVKL